MITSILVCINWVFCVLPDSVAFYVTTVAILLKVSSPNKPKLKRNIWVYINICNGTAVTLQTHVAADVYSNHFRHTCSPNSFATWFSWININLIEWIGSRWRYCVSLWLRNSRGNAANIFSKHKWNCCARSKAPFAAFQTMYLPFQKDIRSNSCDFNQFSYLSS